MLLSAAIVCCSCCRHKMMLIVFSWRGATTVCVSSIYNFPSNFGVVRSTLLTFICLLFQNWQIREKWALSKVWRRCANLPQSWQYRVDVYICFCTLCFESYCSWLENSWSINWLIDWLYVIVRCHDWSIVCFFLVLIVLFIEREINLDWKS